jgi:hypothetical protein
MKSLKSLDDFVRDELKKIEKNGFEVYFSASESYPGQGHFTIKGVINSSKADYRIEFNNTIYLNLCLDGDSVIVHYSKGNADSINVNGRRYYRKLLCEEMAEELSLANENDSETERKEALEFASKAIASTQKVLAQRIPALMKLIEDYYSRSMLPPEDHPDLRSNAEIFAKFGF